MFGCLCHVRTSPPFGGSWFLCENQYLVSVKFIFFERQLQSRQDGFLISQDSSSMWSKLFNYCEFHFIFNCFFPFLFCWESWYKGILFFLPFCAKGINIEHSIHTSLWGDHEWQDLVLEDLWRCWSKYKGIVCGCPCIDLLRTYVCAHRQPVTGCVPYKWKCEPICICLQSTSSQQGEPRPVVKRREPFSLLFSLTPSNPVKLDLR